ncbi:hypothetical protein K505DRAFT_340034 [Melanomma pulvis-pyrius CBS 109.77]|uniref:Uncharacterized protein n=1 Tax=Melanomma pulvis-pyrius CBS 109.77 TaxID=1314802 RepID=A0A6A6X3K6_9PLEO|nr:hypothetical protein K505DRAFT_340034 [Melanomma pulvis-pyrius CBS 109.77]
MRLRSTILGASQIPATGTAAKSVAPKAAASQSDKNPSTLELDNDERSIRAAFTFADAANGSDLTFHTRKLLLGESTQHQAWAYLQLFPRKASEVLIYKEYSAVYVKRLVSGANINGLHLQYPFKVFVNKGNAFAHAQLRVLIQYVFLEAREINKVWATNAKTSLRVFKVALSCIDKASKNIGDTGALSESSYPFSPGLASHLGVKHIPYLRSRRRYNPYRPRSAAPKPKSRQLKNEPQDTSDVALPSTTRSDQLSLSPIPELKNSNGKRRVDPNADFIMYEALRKQRAKESQMRVDLRGRMETLERREEERTKKMKVLLEGISSEELAAYSSRGDAI